jgi:UPF0288 family protein (methanogenesis marker protein 3)
MKYYFTLFLITPLLSFSQDKILFNYDQAGNQILREICINCSSKTSTKTKEELKDDDFLIVDQISYYPNPVLEELYLKWELVPEKKVVEIQLISISGKTLQTYTPKSTEISINFQNYTTGLYLVQFTYNNDERKVIKIVKR